MFTNKTIDNGYRTDTLKQVSVECSQNKTIDNGYRTDTLKQVSVKSC